MIIVVIIWWIAMMVSFFAGVNLAHDVHPAWLLIWPGGWIVSTALLLWCASLGDWSGKDVAKYRAMLERHFTKQYRAAWGMDKEE